MNEPNALHEDLWLVKRPMSIHQPGVGRRDLRPGTIVAMPVVSAAPLEQRGYLERIARAAPLFTDSPPETTRPMRRRKEN